MSVQFQFVDPRTPMGANLVTDGATFRTWALRARNVYLLTGDALSLSATAGRLTRRQGARWPYSASRAADLTHSLQHLRTAAICATPTAGVDVERTERTLRTAGAEEPYRTGCLRDAR
jgi:hypothetical protein